MGEHWRGCAGDGTFIQDTFGLIDTFDALCRLTDLSSALARHLARCGVTHFAVARLPPPGQEAMAPLVLIDHWPVGWMRHYDDRRYAHHDPVLTRMVARSDPFAWADLPIDRRTMPTAHRIMVEAAEAGLVEGFTVPIFDQSGMQGCVTMAGPELDPRCDVRRAVHMLALFGFGAAERLHGAAARAEAEPLTEREREVLRWLAAGHSQAAVADVLGIAERTVENHLRNARLKLNARNATHAVVSAIQRREIRL